METMMAQQCRLLVEAHTSAPHKLATNYQVSAKGEGRGPTIGGVVTRFVYGVASGAILEYHAPAATFARQRAHAMGPQKRRFELE